MSFILILNLKEFKIIMNLFKFIIENHSYLKILKLFFTNLINFLKEYFINQIKIFQNLNH
jgi:hypothetical protein